MDIIKKKLNKSKQNTYLNNCAIQNKVKTCAEIFFFINKTKQNIPKYKISKQKV